MSVESNARSTARDCRGRPHRHAERQPHDLSDGCGKPRCLVLDNTHSDPRHGHKRLGELTQEASRSLGFADVCLEHNQDMLELKQFVKFLLFGLADNPGTVQS